MRGARLPSRLARTLEGEAGFNDPVAVLLVLAMIKSIEHGSYGVEHAIWFFAREIAIGVGVGVSLGWLTGYTLARATNAIPGALALVASLATAAIAFGAAALGEGSGFLAVYVAGLTLGAARLPERPALLEIGRASCRGRGEISVGG